MKKVINLLALGLLLASAHAQSVKQEVVKVKGTRLGYPLIREWANAFSLKHPDIKVVVAHNSPADSIDLTLAAYNVTSAELKNNLEAIVVARYVQLPIVNSERKDLAELQKRGLTEEALGNIFFKESTPSFYASSAPTPLSLYVRDKPVCAVKAFASHYNQKPTSLNGSGVQGDDQDLAKAVKEDVNGFSFNNLGFIYNTTTRKVTDQLAVIPLDLNKNGKVDKEEDIYGSLDTVIEFVERTNNKAFVNEEVNLLFDRDKATEATRTFLQWVLTEGQQYNHKLGFLLTGQEVIDSQKALVAQN